MWKLDEERNAREETNLKKITDFKQSSQRASSPDYTHSLNPIEKCITQGNQCFYTVNLSQRVIRLAQL